MHSYSTARTNLDKDKVESKGLRNDLLYNHKSLFVKESAPPNDRCSPHGLLISQFARCVPFSSPSLLHVYTLSLVLNILLACPPTKAYAREAKGVRTPQPLQPQLLHCPEQEQLPQSQGDMIERYVCKTLDEGWKTR